jgi:hypothetical protein
MSALGRQFLVHRTLQTRVCESGVHYRIYILVKKVERLGDNKDVTYPKSRNPPGGRGHFVQGESFDSIASPEPEYLKVSFHNNIKNVEMAISCSTSTTKKKGSRSKVTRLKNMLQRIRRLSPSVCQSFMPFPHYKIQILILFPLHYTIVLHSFLILCHRTPTISMECIKKC